MVATLEETIIGHTTLSGTDQNDKSEWKHFGMIDWWSGFVGNDGMGGRMYAEDGDDHVCGRGGNVALDFVPEIEEVAGFSTSDFLR